VKVLKSLSYSNGRCDVVYDDYSNKYWYRRYIKDRGEYVQIVSTPFNPCDLAYYLNMVRVHN
jgi:ABC-type amino acid transport substrate-binding protein